MPVTAVIGAQWGDEGKGRIVDYLAQKMDVIVRFNGGPNAGHSVYNRLGNFVLHTVPSGILNEKAICIIGNGVAVNPALLIDEIDRLKQKKISCDNLRISAKAHIIWHWHPLLDALEEIARGNSEIGTTRQGIGPVFSAKYARTGLRVGDLLRLKDVKTRKRFEEYYKNALAALQAVGNLAKQMPDFETLLGRYLSYADKLAPYVAETEFIIWDSVGKKKNVLLEGAQGTMLDIDFGTYPDVTSSFCTSAGACQGSGLPPTKLDEVIGVAKAYTTRVGSPRQVFPTEMPEKIGNALRKRAGEYGATTGRPRRIGWFDAVIVRYAAQVNGFTGLAITRLDNLAGMKELNFCYGYRRKRDGEDVASTLNLETLSIAHLADEDIEPIYATLPGYGRISRNCLNYSQLPQGLRDYCDTIRSNIGVPIKMFSIGPETNQLITS